MSDDAPAPLAPPPVVVALERELRGFRGRLRESSGHWFAVAAPPFASRADVAFHVVRRIASLAYAIEFGPGSALPPLPRLPDFSLADQLDVVAADLLLVARGNEPELGFALSELLLHREHLDGAAPGPAATAVVRQVTGDADAVQWQRRCSASALG